MTSRSGGKQFIPARTRTDSPDLGTLHGRRHGYARGTGAVGTCTRCKATEPLLRARNRRLRHGSRCRPRSPLLRAEPTSTRNPPIAGNGPLLRARNRIQDPPGGRQHASSGRCRGQARRYRVSANLVPRRASTQNRAAAPQGHGFASRPRAIHPAFFRRARRPVRTQHALGPPRPMQAPQRRFPAMAGLPASPHRSVWSTPGPPAPHRRTLPQPAWTPRPARPLALTFGAYWVAPPTTGSAGVACLVLPAPRPPSLSCWRPIDRPGGPRLKPVPWAATKLLSEDACAAGQRQFRASLRGGPVHA